MAATSTSKKMLLLFLTLILIPGVWSMSSESRNDSGRWCFQCLNLECPENNFTNPNSSTREKEVIDFTVNQLRNIFHIPNPPQIPFPCPGDILDRTEWTSMMAVDPPCPNSSATCGAGRLQIKSYFGDDKVPLISHATILGCVKDGLLKSLQNVDVRTVVKAYYSSSANGTEPLSQMATYHRMYLLELDFCSKEDDFDYCIHQNKSVIETFRDVDTIGETSFRRDSYAFEGGIGMAVIVILIVVVILMSGIFVWSCRCRTSLKNDKGKMSVSRGRSKSNTPTISSGAGSDAVSR